jgi:hypothetical protein
VGVGAGAFAHAWVRSPVFTLNMKVMDIMDSNPEKLDVSAAINDIKTHMPETYKSIQAKAKQIGNDAYVLVRRGLRGQANCFYAFERGRVVGTPFALTEVARDVAQHMVTFGCAHVCIWAEPSQGVSNGKA